MKISSLVRHPHRRTVAAGVIAGMTVAGSLVAAMPGAHAATRVATTKTLTCAVFVGGDWVANQQYPDHYTFTQKPADPKAHQRVTVTLKAAHGLKNGPVTIGKGDEVPAATLKVTGATGKSVTLSHVGAYPKATTSPEKSLGGYTLTGHYTRAGRAAVTLQVTQLRFLDKSQQGDTYCATHDAKATTDSPKQGASPPAKGKIGYPGPTGIILRAAALRATSDSRESTR